jgi:hypothetical protein
MGGGGTSCGACKFLRRKCVKGCVFAPYFCSDEMGAPHFGAIHKVFGASNFSKLLMHLPVQERYDTVATVSYEAQARLQDPVHGCVSHIVALQHQVANLKGKLAVGYAQLAACSSSDGASLGPEYGYGQQSEMSSLISNSNSSSPYNQQCLNPWGDPQSIPPENVAVNGEDEGSWGSFSVCAQGAVHPPSTAQETDVFQDAEGFSEQRHPNNYRDGDLQDLASALLRRN